MVVSALRGALGFLTRLPVGGDEADLRAFQETPLAFPFVGYVVGLLVALPLVVGLPATTGAAAYLVVLYLVTGVAHADGLADLGDAAAVHGPAADRREAMKDTTTGVGAVLAVGVVLAALALGALGVAGLPLLVAIGVVVAAEVGAKLAMATVACLGNATHEGLGAGFARNADPALLLGPVLVALPSAFLTFPSPAAFGALGVAVLAGALVLRWANDRLGGVNGDVFGAANEVARVAGLHAGVVVWYLG